MARYRAVLAYDGTAYQGFQRQIDGTPTIQAAVESVLETITQKHVNITAAGRTDTGVHATGQVIAFDLEWSHGEDALLKAINANLPADIALQSIRQQEGFHPRFDARSRTYQYTVVRAYQRQPLTLRYAWQIYRPLDFETMQAAAAMLIGRHDFAAFGNPPQGENTVRDVFRSHWEQHPASGGTQYIYTVEATAFLHHMVRRMVGMQVDVGLGLLSLEEFRQIFESADLSLAKTLAPPQGLVFANVRYDDMING